MLEKGKRKREAGKWMREKVEERGKHEAGSVNGVLGAGS